MVFSFLKAVFYIFVTTLIVGYIYVTYTYPEEWIVKEVNSTAVLSVSVADNSIEVLFAVDTYNNFDCILYEYNCNGNDACLDFFNGLKEDSSYQMIGRPFSRKYCDYCFKDEILCKTDFYYRALVTFIIIYTACSLVLGFFICKVCVCVSDCDKPVNDGYASSSESSRSNDSDPNQFHNPHPRPNSTPTRGRVYWGWRNKRAAKVVPINKKDDNKDIDRASVTTLPGR